MAPTWVSYPFGRELAPGLKRAVISGYEMA